MNTSALSLLDMMYSGLFYDRMGLADVLGCALFSFFFGLLDARICCFAGTI